MCICLYIGLVCNFSQTKTPARSATAVARVSTIRLLGFGDRVELQGTNCFDGSGISSAAVIVWVSGLG